MTRNKKANQGRALIKLIAMLDEEGCVAEVKRLLEEGADPLSVLGWCNEGMRLVGTRYEEGVYFMAALIMAGEIMARATEMISPHLGKSPGRGRPVGRALVATVAGDIHDLGKNVFTLMLRCNGIDVVDLGVDVPTETILSALESEKFDVVGISVTLTSGLAELKKTVGRLKTLPEPRPRILIGGAVVDENVQKHVRADLWAPDAQSGAKLALAACKDKGAP